MALFNTKSVESKVFTENGILAPDEHLKRKDPLREAFVINELSHLPKKSRKEFGSSSAAKYMLENDIISAETLENIVNDNYSDKAEELVVCSMAKENGDDLWDELVRTRQQERDIINKLLATYGESAAPYVKSYREAYVNSSVPKTFLTGE